MDEKKNDRKTQRERCKERDRQTGSRKQTDRGRHKVHRVMEIKREMCIR